MVGERKGRGMRAGEDAPRLEHLCPHPRGSSFERASQALLRAGGWDSGVVVDPFCGEGTTALAARAAGKGVFAIDEDSLSAALCRAKLVNTTPARIEAELSSILRSAQPWDVPDNEFWRWAYGSATLTALMSLRGELRHGRDTAERIALRGLVAGALHGPVESGRAMYLSNHMPANAAPDPDKAVQYWKARGMRPPEVDIEAVISRRARWFYSESLAPNEWRVMEGNPKSVLPADVWEPADLILTHLPSWRRRSVAASQWMRTWFIGGAEALQGAQERRREQSSLTRFIGHLRSVWRVCGEITQRDARLVAFVPAQSGGDAAGDAVFIESLGATVWRVSDARKVYEGGEVGWEFVCEKTRGEVSGERRRIGEGE